MDISNLTDKQKKRIEERALHMALSNYFCNVDDEGWPEDPIDFLNKIGDSCCYGAITLNGEEPNYDDPDCEYMIVHISIEGKTGNEILEMIRDRTHFIIMNFYILLKEIKQL